MGCNFEIGYNEVSITLVSITCIRNKGRRTVKLKSVTFLSSCVAHSLAWAAWLWIAFWPYSYQGVSATPVQVDELGNVIGTAESEVVRYSSSFVEVNGVGPLVLLFIPVILTGLALIGLLTWKRRSGFRVLLMSGLAFVLLAFCGLGYLSFGIMYLPAALALIVATVAYGVRSTDGEKAGQ